MPASDALSALLPRDWLMRPALWRGVYLGEGQLSLTFRAFFASVTRRLGSEAGVPVPSPWELAPLARPHWSLSDWVRAALIARALEAVPQAEQPQVLLRLFDAGEIGEQVSLLRTLSLLPHPAEFVELGIHACRTNAKSVFEAIVCENPFPASHFPALNFNQAILKAVFMDIAMARVEGLEPRITPELQRMAAGYASERRAAGRVVPTDIDYLTRYGVIQ